MDYKPKYDGLVVIHFSLVVTLMISGLQLILPFDTYAGSKNWWLVAQVIPEGIMGQAFIITACLGMMSLVLRGSSPYLSYFFTFIMATFYGIMAISFFYSNPSGIGSLIFVVMAAQGYYLVYRYSYTRNSRRTNLCQPKT